MGAWSNMSVCHTQCLVESLVSLALYHSIYERIGYAFSTRQSTTSPRTQVLRFACSSRLVSRFPRLVSCSLYTKVRGGGIHSLQLVFLEQIYQVASTGVYCQVVAQGHKVFDRASCEALSSGLTLVRGRP
jgi:hypothetical protein